MTTFAEATKSARETYEGCRWVYVELISDESKKYIRISLILLLLAIFSVMSTPFTIKQILDVVSEGNRDGAYVWLGLNIAIGVIATTFGTFYDHFRERAWNNNYYSVNTGLVHKMYRRTLEEIIGENSEIGAEQIESLKDRVQNILYLFLFEASLVLAIILNANVYMFVLDWVAGLMMVGLTLFNLVWFFLFNAKIDSKMEPIDKAFRKASRRLIEKLNLATSVKAAGVEFKIEQQIGEEISGPLKADLQIWAYWFLYVEYTRRIINSIVPALVVGYGIFIAQWNVGTISAMATWAFMISREYGFIGHLMRHLTSQVARIKAARTALSIPPSFEYDEGAIYERNA